MGFWPKNSLLWYDNAAKMFQYPQLPFGKEIMKLISKEDTVLDLGCGIGAASFMISPLCRQVIALEPDENALMYLMDIAKEKNIKNIKAVNDCWPPSKTMEADVIIALHVQGAFKKKENIELMVNSAKKGGFIACGGNLSAVLGNFKQLKEKLDIKEGYSDCKNGCWVKGILDGLGVKTFCKSVNFQFGQPLDSIEEVVEFVKWQIGSNLVTKELLEECCQKDIAFKDGQYIVNIEKNSCAISFIK